MDAHVWQGTWRLTTEGLPLLVPKQGEQTGDSRGGKRKTKQKVELTNKKYLEQRRPEW